MALARQGGLDGPLSTSDAFLETTFFHSRLGTHPLAPLAPIILVLSLAFFTDPLTLPFGRP